MISAFVVIAAVKVVLAFVALLVVTMLVVWMERKVIADMQSRIGPNRWGPFGLGQTLADGIKLFFKEDFRPAAADRWAYALAPIAAMVPSFLAFAVVPIGNRVGVGERDVRLIVTDLNIGLLYFLAMSSLAVYGIVLGGWGSGSKYPLLGGIRSSAQMISYEIALGLSLIPVVIAAGTLSTVEIVATQAGQVRDVTFFEGIPVLEQLAGLFRFVPNWYIWSQWPAFVIFFIAGIAETNRPPFDLPEAETELVAGFHTEYSGVRFAMFFLGEYIRVVLVSAMAVTVFFGGWDGPVFGFLEWIWPLVWFTLKTALFVYLFVWLRATLPRLRYDRLMWLGWKRLIPAALAWIMFTAILNTEALNRNVKLGALAVVIAAVFAVLWRGDPRLRGLAEARKGVASGAS